MKHPDLYAFGPDGVLWTLINGQERRPATAEELEGYCLERLAAAHAPADAPLPEVPGPAREPAPLPIAV